ncbi:MAG: 50S ribosomal protein L9 [Mycoplasmoidaceae bacterium]|nr:50S ribosomal protein L9 [Mycoplasmoidaceae bacterium]
MKLILLVDVKNVGKKNDIIDVKDGYGNFLLNSGKAIANSNKAQEIVKKQVAAAKQQYDYEVKQATMLKNKIESITLEFSLKTNHGQAFGSISNKQVIDQLANKHNIKIDKFMMTNATNSYGLGQHRISIKLHKDVIASLLLRVTGE